jgi:hypothetical protein
MRLAKTLAEFRAAQRHCVRDQPREEITMSRNQFFAAAFSVAFVASGARAENSGDLIVRNVDAGAYVTRYTLERVCDGAFIEVEIGGRALQRAPIAAGTRMIATRTMTGAVLSIDGEAIGSVPAALAQALLPPRMAA